MITRARRRIVFTSAADLEVAAAALWYDAQQSGLGDRFLEAIETAATSAARAPQLYFRLHAELRRILVHRFPYGLMFRDTDTELLIVSCYHLHEDPAVWQSRG